MGILIFTVIVLVGIVASLVSRNSREMDTKENSNQKAECMKENIKEESEMNERREEEKEGKNIDTRDLMAETLISLGCQPEKLEEDSLVVKYQGENFLMKFGGKFAQIWDLKWSGIEVNDPDLPKVREAVNIANFSFGPTVVMTAPDEDGIIGLHSRREVMLHPEYPDNAGYVKSVLESFFDMKQEVKGRFQQLTVEQAESQKKRRPVGFATDVSEG